MDPFWAELAKELWSPGFLFALLVLGQKKNGINWEPGSASWLRCILRIISLATFKGGLVHHNGGKVTQGRSTGWNNAAQNVNVRSRLIGYLDWLPHQERTNVIAERLHNKVVLRLRLRLLTRLAL